MNPTTNTGRMAGFLYVLIGLTAPFSLLYVPSRIIASNDAETTAHNIIASESILRLGVVAELASSIVFVVLAMVLYRLLNNVDRMQASLMVAFAVLSVPVSFVGVVNDLAAIPFAKGDTTYLHVFDPRQLHAMAHFFVTLHGKTLLVNQIFWGVWLIPFGVLVMRSRFIPRILGILLIVNGSAYVIVSTTGLLAPSYLNIVDKYAFPAKLGELWMMLWLLIKGADVEA